MFLLPAWPPLFRRGENRPINEQFVEQGRSFPLHRNIPTFPRFLTRRSGSVPFCSVLFRFPKSEKRKKRGQWRIALFLISESSVSRNRIFLYRYTISDDPTMINLRRFHALRYTNTSSRPSFLRGGEKRKGIDKRFTTFKLNFETTTTTTIGTSTNESW